MGSELPKQYMPLGGKPLALHSFEMFLSIKEISQIVVVADTKYHEIFEWAGPKITFAEPGEMRQDSVYNGSKEISDKSDLVLIHDGARPFIREDDIRELITAGLEAGAAVLAKPSTNTIKECEDFTVKKTLERKMLWEMQTPQALKPGLLRRGFELVKKRNMTLTDDVQLAEVLSEPVKVVRGPDTNIKITTPLDYLLAKSIHEKAL